MGTTPFADGADQLLKVWPVQVAELQAGVHDLLAPLLHLCNGSWGGCGADLGRSWLDLVGLQELH